MSRSSVIAEAIAKRLNAQIPLKGVIAIAARQKDLSSDLEIRVGKAGGGAIIVQYEGFSNPNANGSGNPTVIRNYTASIYTVPILRDDEIPADDIEEFVAKKLHNWELAEDLTGAVELSVKSSAVVPDKKYLIYQLDIEVISRL